MIALEKGDGGLCCAPARMPPVHPEGRTREWPAAASWVSELRAREFGGRGFQPTGHIARVRPSASLRIRLSHAARTPFPCPQFACPIFPQWASFDEKKRPCPTGTWPRSPRATPPSRVWKLPTERPKPTPWPPRCTSTPTRARRICWRKRRPTRRWRWPRRSRVAPEPTWSRRKRLAATDTGR